MGYIEAYLFMSIQPKELLAQLVTSGVIDKEQSQRLELESIQKNIPLDQYLLQTHTTSKETLLQASAQVMHVPFTDLNKQPIDPHAVSLLSEGVARTYHILPFSYDQPNDTLYVASSDPHNADVSEFLSRKVGKRVQFTLADPEAIEKSFGIAYAQGGLSPEVKEALKEYQPDQQILDAKEANQSTAIKEAPVAKIVSTILEFAMKSRASDVHIEPEELRSRVRYRIDGFLQEKLSLPPTIHEALISRIKILSQMKIDERRIPQDGRFTFRIAQQEIDLRVSTLPTVHGEKIVMRLLKKSGGIPTFNELGLRGAQLQGLQTSIARPHGIVLVTGPTGSGKTTTLYSILSQINKPNTNILTLEDPVEYQMEGINQVQINPQAGLTFASGLRAFLRQDPNVILVGEIRDQETTQLAVQAALTGHLVFSTLHTNDSATAIPRLVDLGAEPFLIATVLNGVLAQRIVRRICSDCTTPYTPDETVAAQVRQVLGDLLPQKYKQQGQPIQLHKGRGCEACGDSGYRGRIGIFEFFATTPTITRLIVQQVNSKDIETQAQKEGMMFMIQDGYLKALDGLTTIEEIFRVAQT